ncbi:MAG: hypothetical protein K9L68_13735 [Spirochaetales bacterium]|nr:hypothetical protein [Spirochaetales bacterium]MCF7939653.1 hypothetical protein [Spirochaetales bacterium]
MSGGCSILHEQGNPAAAAGSRRPSGAVGCIRSGRHTGSAKAGKTCKAVFPVPRSSARLGTVTLSFLLAVFLSLVFVSCGVEEVEIPPPKGFAVAEENGNLETNPFVAVSPEGVVYRVRMVANEPEQDLDFWAEALERRLGLRGYVPVESGSMGKGQDRPALSWYEWSAPYGGEAYRYLTALSIKGDRILVVEAAGKRQDFLEYRSSVMDALSGIYSK